MRVSEAFFKIIRLSCPIIYQTKPWSFNENKSWSWKYKQTPKSPTAWISLLFPYQNVLPSSPLLWEITLVSEQKGTLFLMTTLKQVVYTLQCLGKSIISLITLSSLEILPPLLKKKKKEPERIIQEIIQKELYRKVGRERIMCLKVNSAPRRDWLTTEGVEYDMVWFKCHLATFLSCIILNTLCVIQS